MTRSKKILYQIIQRGILFFTASIFFILIVLIIFDQPVHDYFYKNWIELLQMVGTTMVGGILVYCIIWVAENKRDQHRHENELLKEKKKASAHCTQVLLSAQMTILSQIEELKFLEKFCRTIINFPIAKTTLGAIHLQNKDPQIKADILAKMLQAEPEKFKDLIGKTKHIPTKHMLNNVIHLPFSLFAAPTFMHANAEVANYIHELSRCNRKYMKIISFTERQNEIRDIIVMRPIKKQVVRDIEDHGKETNIILIVGMIAMVCRLNEKITEYFATADTSFNQTAAYVKKLGMSVPLLREQDYLLNV